MRSEKKYMQRAIDLALKGLGRTNPNPLVGAVIVKNNKIIGQGYHESYGSLHAERNALASASESVKGATLYVTLEPCCHYGKTPPCTEAIIQSGISNVVIGSSDPNPLVSGKGVKCLQAAGINVIEDFMKPECDEINPFFFHYINTGRPYVTMKYAMTIDGKIATYTGKSQWITGDIARKHVHEQRNRYAAIMIGIGTVISDDPLLTCRLNQGRNPIRIICDSNLSIPMSSNIVKTAHMVPTIIATTSIDSKKHNLLKDKGCKVMALPSKNNKVDLNALMEQLSLEKIDSILLEGGANLNWSAWEEGIVNNLLVYIGNKVFGGSTAKSPVAGKGYPFPSDADEIRITNRKVTMLGDDILIESEVRKCLQE